MNVELWYFNFAVIPACPESNGHAATVKTDSGRASLAGMTAEKTAGGQGR